MDLPNFLLADNSDEPDRLYIIHMHYPRFAWDVTTDEVEWMDDLDEAASEEDLINEVALLMETAEAFYEREITRHETAATAS